MTNTWPGWENAGIIGEGSFGKVYRIRREEFGKTYEAALKVITIPASQADVRTAFEEGMDEESVTDYFRSFVEDIVAEFALMSELKGNSNIVSYEDHMVVEHEDGIGWDILIRMELLTALPDYAAENPLKEADVIRLGIDMAKALELCRMKGIVHRDIKPENIFVSKVGDFKLGDFGVARVAEKTISAMSRKGTYNYMAPEVYKGEEYGYAADMYSVGLVLYRFLNDNRTPFLPPYPERIRYSDKERALNERISGIPIPAPAHGSKELQAVVLRACAFRPEERYGSGKELREALAGLLTETAAEPKEKPIPAKAEKEIEEKEPETVREETAKKLAVEEPDREDELEKTMSVLTNHKGEEPKSVSDMTAEEGAEERAEERKETEPDEAEEAMERTISVFSEKKSAGTENMAQPKQEKALGQGQNMAGFKSAWYQNGMVGAFFIPVLMFVEVITLSGWKNALENPIGQFYRNVLHDPHTGFHNSVAQVMLHSVLLVVVLMLAAAGMAYLWEKIWQGEEKRKKVFIAGFLAAVLCVFWLRGTILDMIYYELGASRNQVGVFYVGGAYFNVGSVAVLLGVAIMFGVHLWWNRRMKEKTVKKLQICSLVANYLFAQSEILFAGVRMSEMGYYARDMFAEFRGLEPIIRLWWSAVYRGDMMLILLSLVGAIIMKCVVHIHKRQHG